MRQRSYFQKTKKKYIRGQLHTIVEVYTLSCYYYIVTVFENTWRGHRRDVSSYISFPADRVANSCRRISLKNIPFIFRAKYWVVYKEKTRNSSWRGLIAFFVVVKRLRVVAEQCMACRRLMCGIMQQCHIVCSQEIGR